MQARVKELNDKLKVLTDEFDAANKTKQDAINTVETGQRKLGLANRLINALASENVRKLDSLKVGVFFFSSTFSFVVLSHSFFFSSLFSFLFSFFGWKILHQQVGR